MNPWAVGMKVEAELHGTPVEVTLTKAPDNYIDLVNIEDRWTAEMDLEDGEGPHTVYVIGRSARRPAKVYYEEEMSV